MTPANTVAPNARVKKSLRELRTTGWRTLKPGKIHIRCYGCGRKQSNMDRTEYDPPNAFLIENVCEKCGQGSKDPEFFYFDANGIDINIPFDDDGAPMTAAMAAVPFSSSGGDV